MTDTSAGTEALPNDWSRVLGVVAHPDDLEYGASAALARMSRAGAHVTELLVTRGEAGIDSIPPEECAPIRMREQEAAGSAVGASGVEFLEFPDGALEYGLPLRRQLARAIRVHRPDLVISLNFRESFEEGGSFNHPDHRALGPALLDAVVDAANRWMFPDLAQDGLPPWKGVRYVAFANPPHPTHHVELSEADLQAGIASLVAHEVYFANLDQTMDAESFLREIAERNGAAAGVPLAAAFEAIPC
ncbi:PIG-L deacetylase family protein [Lipingzhangella sp. LS1_29]|uniref:PIG-L deacetylase family protein n=1 Tax=Lipingzhangella rawalii TaxID=2055835 RepID=A0ABU2H1U1_9ACTN|nr:PIG-L deacetylase family protein [Lipingzhangella rawalii]MDS1268830.1 PIG-L deacetylase family protein [Lipingzhangella rawalii]